MFNSYSVLTQLLNNKKLGNHVDFFIISVQHILGTTGSMFESLIQYGFVPNQIYLTGKLYSTHKETQVKLTSLGINVIDSSVSENLGSYSQSLENDVKKMWEMLSEKLQSDSKIIILDDGGYTLKNTPQNIIDSYEVFGIEQTTSGIKMQNVFGKFPVIHLASSAAKVVLEPKIVSDSVRIQLGSIIERLSPQKIGIVGYGHIGKAIAKDLRNKYKVLVFDIKNEMNDDVLEDIIYCSTYSELIDNVGVLIGATGQDISSIYWFQKISKDITLISVSSGDIEFNTLLKNSKPRILNKINTPLDSLKIKTDNEAVITILRGGMVANFTGSLHSGPDVSIQMTRGLIFSAIIQIIENTEKLQNKYGPIMLSPILQKKVVKYWFEDQPQLTLDYDLEVIQGFKKLDWVKENSGGQFVC